MAPSKHTALSLSTLTAPSSASSPTMYTVSATTISKTHLLLLPAAFLSSPLLRLIFEMSFSWSTCVRCFILRSFNSTMYQSPILNLNQPLSTHHQSMDHNFIAFSTHQAPPRKGLESSSSLHSRFFQTTLTSSLHSPTAAFSMEHFFLNLIFLTFLFFLLLKLITFLFKHFLTEGSLTSRI